MGGMVKNWVCISACRGQLEVCRPDLESPRCALSTETTFSKTLQLELSIHGGHAGKNVFFGIERGQNWDKKRSVSWLV